MISKTGTSDNTLKFFCLEKYVITSSFAKFPLDEGTVLGITQFAEISTGMISDFVEDLFVLVAVLFQGRKVDMLVITS